MSQGNVETLHEGLDAFNRRDRPAWLRFYDPDFFVNVPPSDWPESAPIRGPDAAWDIYTEAQAGWQATAYEWGEVIDVDSDKVVAHLHAQVRGSASGASVHWSYWNVVTFRRGMLLRAEWFASRDETLEAAGLSE